VRAPRGHVEVRYDQVAITDDTGTVKLCSREQYEAMPLAMRVRAMLAKRLRFYKLGTEVPAKEALGE
jgi:hypothetical protein